MPLIKVQASISLSCPQGVADPSSAQVSDLLKQLSAALAKHTRKPETYVMTAFESNVPMTFAGTTDPTCYIEIKSVGSMTPEQTQSMSQDFCQQIQRSLNIPIDRIYIEFADAKGYMWGWNGATFG